MPETAQETPQETAPATGQAPAPPAAVRKRSAAIAFGVVDAVAAALVAFGVYGALPARFWPVDTLAAVVILLLAGAAFGLLRSTAWAERVARIASLVVLGLGLLLVATLALTASYLSGIYGPVGHGGAIILVLVAALALPYLVVLPGAQLLWLGPRSGRGRSGKSSP
jgi:hypothetical protein